MSLQDLNPNFELNLEDWETLTTKVVENAREDLLAYILAVNPNFIVAPHHRLMADKLMLLKKGEIDRLMIFISPRSSKSFMGSVYYPSWCLGNFPSWQLMALSYSSTLAADFGREVRNLVASREFEMIFPHISLRADSRSAARWHTNHNGVFTSAGITGGIAGRGAHVAVIDDPLSEQDAFQKTARDHVIRWYPGGLRTRLMPGGRVVIIQTRWHEEDLSGWLLEEEKHNETADKWAVVNIPAILDEETADILGDAREALITQGFLPEDAPKIIPGGSYWPVQKEYEHSKTALRGWHLHELERTKNNMPPYQWSALYMQKPVPEEGGILKKDDWKMWKSKTPPTCTHILMSLDTAYETKNYSDYSAMTVWGVFQDNRDIPNMILLAAKKGRWEYPDLRKMVQEQYDFYKPDTVLIEKKASGQSLIQDLNRSGVPVLPYNPEKDKVSRAHACTPILHSGRVWAPEHRQFSAEVINECAAFPNGTYDDYVDSTTQAILWLISGTWVTHPDDFETPPSNLPRKYY